MTSSSDEKADRIRQHLSHLIKTEDSFQVINRRKHPKVETEVERLTTGKKADFIIEIGGIKTLPSSIRCIKQGGLVALTGMLTTHQDGENPTDGMSVKRMSTTNPFELNPLISLITDIATLLLWGGQIARGITCCKSRFAQDSSSTNLDLVPHLGPRDEMKRLHRALEASQFHPLIDKVFEFDQLKEAYDYSLGSDFLGKIVIKVAK